MKTERRQYNVFHSYVLSSHLVYSSVQLFKIIISDPERV